MLKAGLHLSLLTFHQSPPLRPLLELLQLLELLELLIYYYSPGDIFMSEYELSLSVSEVAALSGVSEKIVRNEIHRGIIPPGSRRAQRKHWRFPPDAVAYFMLFSKIPFPKEDSLGRLSIAQQV